MPACWGLLVGWDEDGGFSRCCAPLSHVRYRLRRLRPNNGITRLPCSSATRLSDSSTPLSTTIKDARAIADEFRRYNFDVDVKENVGKDDMRRAIDAFTSKIGNGTVALFYFSGFGIQVARQTYLIPVNAQVWTEDDTKRDGISLDGIVADMQRKGARVKIVIVDASRRNPFERRFRSAAAGIAALDARRIRWPCIRRRRAPS